VEFTQNLTLMRIRNFGQLARILEGQKEGLADLAWHPTRPVVASVSMSGVIYLWAKDYTENWSAFAPDFKELEENEEYVEREDEFDIMPETDKVGPEL
jgi:COMPASS component SWD1